MVAVADNGKYLRKHGFRIRNFHFNTNTNMEYEKSLNHETPPIANVMLSVRSLCVGNFLKRNGIVVTIDAKSIFDIWSNEGIVRLGYEPIPITMEWIEKLGFVFEEIGEEPTLEEQSYRKAICGYGSKSFEIEFNRYEDAFALDFVTGELIHYKYVHELQNLYYMLNGSELSWDADNGSGFTDFRDSKYNNKKMKNYVVGIFSIFENDLKLFKVVAENEYEAVKKGLVESTSNLESKQQEIDWQNSEDYPTDMEGLYDVYEEVPFSVVEVGSF